MSGPRASAVIICYNGAAYVAKAIESVLAQEMRDFELLVVDDGSTDDSRTIVQAYAAGDARVRLVCQSNQGPSAARNTGAREAVTPWVAYLDADDWWHPDKLGAQLNAVARMPDAALVYCGATYVKGDESTPALRGSIEGLVLDELLLHNFVATSSAMVRREVLFEVGGWDEGLRQAEDWDVWLRVAARHPVAGVDRILVYKHCVPASLGSQPQAMAAGAQFVLERAFSTYARHRAAAVRARALANMHFLAALNFNEARDRLGERRELMRMLRYRPLAPQAYRRLLRSMLPG